MDNFGSKQTADAYYVTFDFAAVLATGDEIASATVSAAEGAVDKTTDVTDSTKQNISGTKVNVWVKAGTSGHTYTITCRITTTVSAEIFEMEAGQPVADT